MESRWRLTVAFSGWAHRDWDLMARILPGFPDPTITHAVRTGHNEWYFFRPDVFVFPLMSFTYGSGPHTSAQIYPFVVPDM